VSASTAAATGTGWSRGRLLVIVAGVGAAALLVVAGLVYAVYLLLAPEHAAGGGTASGPAPDSAGPNGPAGDRSTVGPRDRIAAAPMLRVEASDALPAPPAAALAPAIGVPAATTIGPAGVASGFPRTPGGALGQLAAIDVAVLETMSIAAADAVYGAWAMPGGVGVDRWQVTGSVRAFLGAAGMGPEKDLTAVIRMTSVGGIVKGGDGPDWVVVCVLFDVRVSYVGQGRVGYGDCQRMQWTPDPRRVQGRPAVGGRWMIAPGAAPARAPSVWPGSDLAARAGWHRWAAQPGETSSQVPAQSPVRPGRAGPG
jgi:hypothetical protein